MWDSLQHFFNISENLKLLKNKSDKNNHFLNIDFFPSRTNGKKKLYYFESNVSHVLGQNHCVLLATKRLWAGKEKHPPKNNVLEEVIKMLYISNLS